MNKLHKYKPNDIGNFTDEPVKRTAQDRSQSNRMGQRKDKKHLHRIKPASSFVVPWQMYEADPYESTAE